MSTIKPFFISRLSAVRDAWTRRRTRADLLGRIAAIDQVQAVIEFTPAGMILDANETFLRAFGYTRDQVIGQHHRMFVDPTERESDDYRAFWQRLGEGRADRGMYGASPAMAARYGSRAATARSAMRSAACGAWSSTPPTSPSSA